VAELVALGLRKKARMHERKSASAEPCPAPYGTPLFLNSWQLEDDTLKEGGVDY
jgi:hypothetical protein